MGNAAKNTKAGSKVPVSKPQSNVLILKELLLHFFGSFCLANPQRILAGWGSNLAALGLSCGT